MKKEHDTERLEEIYRIVNSDAGFESDCVFADRNATSREKVLAELVSDIYNITHQRFSKCCGTEWANTKLSLLKRRQKQKRLTPN